MKAVIEKVYKMLKARDIHPLGEFDNQGRFYIYESDLVDVRQPSCRFPYSEMKAGRTKKFVRKLVAKYNITTESKLLTHFQ